MSHPSTPKPAAKPSQGPFDPKIGLMFITASRLIPFFQTSSIDIALAHKIAISAIAAYMPEDRADYINIARTIAFSTAALALLGKAIASDMPLPEQMRAYGRANALNRSADQSERTMMLRRSYQKANPMDELPAWMNPGVQMPEPEKPIDTTEIDAVVAEAVKAMEAQFTTPKAAAIPPEPATQNAAISPLQPPAASPDTGIRYNAPMPGTGQSQKAPYKAALLQNSAMPPVAGQRTGPHTRAA
jgi:hypothetical protein